MRPLCILLLLSSGCLLISGTFRQTCGDGQRQDPEECDDGNKIDGDLCSRGCLFELRCGDGILSEGEECEDSNTQNGDGCDQDCKVEIPITCGDGSVDSVNGEECDDGCNNGTAGVCEFGIDDGDGCDSNCKVTGCNNNIILPGEICLTSGTPLPVINSALHKIRAGLSGNSPILFVHDLVNQRILVLRPDAAGSLIQTDAETVPTAAPGELLVGDFNNDGNSDVLFVNDNATTNQFVRFVGDNTGTLIPISPIQQSGSLFPSAALAPLDADPEDDIIAVEDLTGSNNQVLVFLSSNNFASPQILPVPHARSVLTRDLNADGAQDAVVTFDDGNSSNVEGFVTLQGDASGFFTQNNDFDLPNNCGITLGTFGSFDTTASIDLALGCVINIDNSLELYFQAPNQFFLGPFTIPIGGFMAGLTAADFDHDGRDDLVYTSSSGQQGLFLVSDLSTTGGTTSAAFDIGQAPSDVTTLDVNGDGLLDIAALDRFSSIRILRQTP